jgi:DNA-binding MarR family transcriptional regulator
MTSLVMMHMDDWRRQATALTGMPFGRVRVLRRLADGPLTLGDLAHASSIDRPAATVAVNYLEERGLVIREFTPGSRRSKTVSLTPAGRDLVDRLTAIRAPAPPELAALAPDELETLAAVVERLGASAGLASGPARR